MTTTLTRPESDTDRPERHRLSVVGELADMSLDAMASVAYGPEAIVTVLAVAGGSDAIVCRMRFRLETR
ncbi:hypothetical protein [Amycolatopsis sp. lyj-90]|uniref:hypothetical protein n=1 Tax=Amycolatopsis sp. lyj-90 TaxID=2789285 RepID=UPI00397BFB39